LGVLFHFYKEIESKGGNAMGDFTGFSFNGVHIDNVRIVRVSDGSRYNDTILPTFTDKTVAVPGGNGTYFFGSYYT
jgi:hypothetical protein